MITTSGASRGGRLERRHAVGGLADDLEVVVQLEEVAHPAADHRVVVDEQDADPARPPAIAVAHPTDRPTARVDGLAAPRPRAGG